MKEEREKKALIFPAALLLSVGLLTLAACTGPARGSPSPTTPPIAASATASPTRGITAAAPAPTETLVATPSLPAPCAETEGRVSQHTLKSKYLTDGLRFSIYLPPCFDSDSSQTYPVLYLFHGQTYDDDQWIHVGAPIAADRLIAEGDVPPFMIVMPYDKSSAQPWQDPFDQAFQDELLPYIETTYPACADRACRAVGGLSRGGGWSIHYGLTRPDLFGAVGGHSPAIFDSEGPRLSRLLNGIPPGQMPRWFLDVGEDDRLVTSTRLFEQNLTGRGIPHDWRLYTGVHNEEYWSKHVEEYLRWYAQGWQEQSTQTALP